MSHFLDRLSFFKRTVGEFADGHGIVWVSLILNYLTEVRRASVMGEATLHPSA